MPVLLQFRAYGMNIFRKLITIISFVNHHISHMGVYLAMGMLFFMTVFVLLNVFLRNLGFATGNAVEISVILMVWLTFLVASYAYRHHLFTRIDLIFDYMSLQNRLWLNLILHIVEFFILFLACHYAWIFFQSGNRDARELITLSRTLLSPFLNEEQLYQIRFKEKWSYLFVFNGFLFMLLVSFEHILRSIYSIIVKEDCSTIQQPILKTIQPPFNEL